MVSLKYFVNMTKDYWGGFGFATLFVVGLIAILFLEK